MSAPVVVVFRAKEVTANNSGPKLRFGTVSQTLGSLTIGAGATVVFTSGLASCSFGGGEGGGKGGGKGAGFGGGAVVPEPGTIGLLLVGALGMMGRSRRQWSEQWLCGAALER